MLSKGRMILQARAHQGKLSSCHVWWDKQRGSGAKMILVCHVILQDHETKGWSNIVGGSPLWQVTSLPSLAAIAIVVVEI